MTDVAKLRGQLMRQMAHWRAAVITIDDADNFSGQESWGRIERYLGLSVRQPLHLAVARLSTEAKGLSAQLAAAETLEQLELVRMRMLSFRRAYIATETTLDFYGDAVNTRTSLKISSILRALDLIAVRSMETVLRPLGRETPAVLTYIDKGLGASILRAGVRLWDGAAISPVAAIKITRHNLYRPTSLIHETGHQVAHILGWSAEFADVVRRALAPEAPPVVVDAWTETASEIVADIHAFVHCGYGAVAALHDVVAADEDAVLRYVPGDPHPIPFIRVLLNVEYCRAMYGVGPWDDLAAAWRNVHPIGRAAAGTREFLEHSVALLPRLAELSLKRQMRCFGGRAIVDLVEPALVRPEALLQWFAQMGGALATSMHWANVTPVRLLALSSLRMAIQPERSAEIAEDYERWTQRVGSSVRAA